MKRSLASLIVVLIAFCTVSHAQPNSNAFPAALATAKTIAIENDTHVDAITDGPDDRRCGPALRQEQGPRRTRLPKAGPGHWPDELRLQHELLHFVHMKVYLKDADTPFYTTKTDDSKKKAGISCVNDFRTAFRAAR
jgi:hypothetical protein